MIECVFDKILAFMRYDADVGCGLVITLSRSLVGKVRGCDIDFLRCSFRPWEPLPCHAGEMPSPKIGSPPVFSERSIRPAALPRVSAQLDGDVNLNPHHPYLTRLIII